MSSICQPPTGSPATVEWLDSKEVVAWPLYVDLDGTLVQSDTLHESVLMLLRQRPWMLWFMIAWLFGGRAYFKRRVAALAVPDPKRLPYTPAFLAWLTAQHAAGRPLVLATAADMATARVVADHLGLFEDVLATNQPLPSGGCSGNLSGEAKRRAIEAHVQQRGGRGYAYAGNSRDDLPVWAGAAEAVAVHAPDRVLADLRLTHPGVRVFGATRPGWRLWIKALRISQWSKNALLFVPLLAAQLWSLQAWGQVGLAVLAFGLFASATYLINDLLDLPNDRRHPHKRHRPLAAGQLKVPSAVLAIALILPVAYLLASLVSLRFLGIVTLYTVATLAYSLVLKRVALLDVLVLSGLFTLRILAGAVAGGVAVSTGMLSIAFFLFLGLALLKRCAELEQVLHDPAREHVHGRPYHQAHLPGLRAIGMASSIATVVMAALYVSSHGGRGVYASPEWLWGTVPLLLWWLMRLWIKAGRRELRGDGPLEFALQDGFSWGVLLALVGLGLLASWG